MSNMLSECCNAKIEQDYHDDEGTLENFCSKCGEQCQIWFKEDVNSGEQDHE